jgi:TPP-dependent indolepyruvate ferredoxin oxidoreductase alpha subunit
MVRQFWWQSLEREIKFLEKKISRNQSELNNLPPEIFFKDLIQYEPSPESPAKSLQLLQESIKNFEIQILQQNLNSINDSKNNGGFEIILSLKATYQNLKKWLERLESQKNILHITRINVKNLDTSEVSPKIQLDLTVNGFQIPEK